MERTTILVLALGTLVLAGPVFAGAAAPLGEEPAERGPVIERDALIAVIESAIKETATRPALLADAAGPGAPLESRAIAREAGRIRISVSWREWRIEEILGYLRKVTSLNFVVSARAKAALAEAGAKVTLDVANLSLDNILDLVAVELGEFRFTIRSGAILLVRADEYRPPTVLRIYDVRDLLRPRPDFPAPALGASLKAPDEER